METYKILNNSLYNLENETNPKESQFLLIIN